MRALTRFGYCDTIVRMDKKLVSMLKKVQKPSRYVGGEICMPPIDEQTRVKFCLCFPDTYEVGMSNLGIRILYHMLNDRKGYCCERCFAPWPDFGRQLKKEKYPLFSLETKTPLNKFDLLGFSFGYELSYTNFLYMLDLAQIPFRAKDRDGSYPLIYGGGLCMSNPEPLADFLDFAVIGDGENITIKVIDTIMKCKLSKLSKEQTLELLSQLEGVYVPSKVKVVFNHEGQIKELSGKTVKRQIIRDLDRTYFPTKLLVPNEQPIFDRGMIEIMRGCTRGCRFCQAGFLYRPARERRVQSLVSHARAQIYNCGVEEMGVCSLSTSDYSKLPELIQFLDPLCKEAHVKLSLPSLRVDSFKGELASVVGVKTLTFAPEAGTQRLRDIINKNITDQDIDSALVSAYQRGVRSVKLYFMSGLPFETANDIIGIVEIVNRAKKLYKENRVSKQPLNLSVSVSTFIPKAFTPFQWCAFVGENEAKKRQALLTFALKKLGVKLSFSDIHSSKIEAILSRGDRRLSKVLEYAYYGGAIFDSWSELFNYEAYQKAFTRAKIDENFYLSKKDEKDKLPWDLVDCGITKSFLLSEYNKAKSGAVTKDCRQGCNGCGLMRMGVCGGSN